MDLEQLRIFVAVASLASFSRAADQLGFAKGHVSTSIQRLEMGLGTRLLQRTTRRVRLTHDGEQFLARCHEVLGEAERLQAMFQPSDVGLTGKLRIDLPYVFAREVIIPRLPEFLAAHPLLEVGVSTTDRRVDLVHEGFDCVMVVGALSNSDLMVRTVGGMRMTNAASPEYLRRHGMPVSVADLGGHRVVHYSPSLTSSDAAWNHIDENGKLIRTPMRAAIAVNGFDAYNAAAVAGLGLIQAPLMGLRRHILQGSLIEVLPAWRAPPIPISLLYANRRQLAPRVDAAMRWLSSILVEYLDDQAGQLVKL